MEKKIELKPLFRKKTKIDKVNRVYIPKCFREELIDTEGEFEVIFCENNQLLIRKIKSTD